MLCHDHRVLFSSVAVRHSGVGWRTLGKTSDSHSELESQRRSRAWYVHIQVRIDWNLEDQTLISEEAETVVVNAHGALVRLDLVPPLGQK